ncbi:MAG: hypothetical protein AW07_02485 [Candidatus Accumulibacter sp. SK-11]|nr:MAG: hypothetical protein AW07_02485 [Candidatus Accumulibacter sp. SK-11]
MVVRDQDAGLAGDDHRRFGDLRLLAQGLQQHRQFIGVDQVHAFVAHAECLDEANEIDPRRLVAMDVATAAGIVLAAGHADGAIVEQQDGDVALVVNDVEQPLHAHVQEGRVADDGDDLAILLVFAAALVETECHAH